MQLKHNKTPEDAKEIRNSLKSKNRVRARNPQSQEPGMVQKRKIAPPTNTVKDLVEAIILDARQCQGASEEESESVAWSNSGKIST